MVVRKKFEQRNHGNNGKFLRPIIKRRKLQPTEKKKVTWTSEERLISVKVFKMTDEPTAKGMTKDEIEKYLKEAEHLATMPHQFQETRLKEKQMEKAAMGKLREKENIAKKQILSMQPDCEWKQPKSNLIFIYF